MSVSSWLAALRRSPATVQLESPRYSSPVWAGQFSVPSELFLTADQQMAVSVAWACISAIVDPIASSDIKVWQDDNGARKEDRESWLYWLLNVEPHPAYTAQGWGELMASRAVATGNSYAHIYRDGSSRPASLQPLDPNRVLGDDDNGAIFYRYQSPIGGEVLIPEADMIHIRGPMRSGAFYGDSPLARASAALALARAQELYATAYYANGAYPGVLLKPPANATAPTKEEKEKARDIWRKLFGGPRKRGGIGTLDPGWSLEIVETNAEKSQVVEARKAQVAEILRYFGVPGHLVGVPESSQGYGKNLAELGLGFVRQTLEPWSRRIGEELRRKLMPGRRQGQAWFIEYDLSRLTKGDEESVARAEDTRLKNGSSTINEVRAARGEPAVDGGDIPLVNGKPLEQVIDPPAPPLRPSLSVVSDENAEPAQAALMRHARRARARRADITSKGGNAEDVARHMERLRGRARDELRECGVSDGPATEVALSAVECGIDPKRAATRLAGGEAM